MHFINQSIARQLVFWTVLPLFLLSIIVGINHVSNVKVDTEKRVEAGINDIVERNAMKIKSFFEAKGQVIHSVFANPQVKNWFSDYNDRGGDLSNDGNYQQIVQYFKYFSNQDPTIKSVFFGSANTFFLGFEPPRSFVCEVT